MPHRPYTLAPVIHIDALYARMQQLCAALGLEWAPTHTPPVITQREEGPFILQSVASSWSDGVITLTLCQESGDNGATHHMLWEGRFIVHAILDGLPHGASIHMDGYIGVTELTHVRVEGADEAMTATILAALGAQRPATS
jgi:hypothetical protein